MPSWTEKPVTVPAVNVSLEHCAHAAKGHPLHTPYCSSQPVLIPCPLPRSVTFTVRLGECNCTIPSWWTRTANAHSKADRLSGREWSCACGPCSTARRNGWAPDQHNASCPAHPIRVTCSISGKTWEESEVDEIGLVGRGPEDFTRSALAAGDVDFFSDSEREHALAACRERWALVKALVLGKQAEPAETEPVRSLIAQRDAVFAALADMARAEEAALSAQQRVDEAFPFARYRRNDADHRSERPSVGRLGAYVEHLVEQVGVMS